jgi:metal dependent phosphohydrolase
MFNLTVYFERNFVKEYKMSKKASKIVEEFSKFKGLEKSLIRKICIGTELSKVGYIGLPKQIIEKLKNNQPLITEETLEYRQYPQKGIEILSAKYKKEYDDIVVLGIIREHAERIDGKGFPSGLAGEAILDSTYIASICIWFVEETSKGKTIWQILNKLERDPGMVPKAIKDDFIKFLLQKNDRIEEILNN